MPEDQPQPSLEELAKSLSRAGVPRSILFYVILGVISGARKLMTKAALAGCPPDDTSCVDFTDVAPGTDLDATVQKQGFAFTATQAGSLGVVGWGMPTGKSKLRVPEKGVQVRLPYAVGRVTARVAQSTAEPVWLRAYHDSDLIGEKSAPAVVNALHTLTVEGEDITLVAIGGGQNEGVLLDLCIPAQAAATG